ncbi:hypothetical protein ZIOFF_031990 [Zingiber officinale]|uniref:Uncharacterized protein n=1 Tax=Zingiber officinale TaxID=94328 RepID=A0A8J5L5D2_ZINOF|nr:hypothetical protein ZIOFF_031990 [Zingiber officinale]
MGDRRSSRSDVSMGDRRSSRCHDRSYRRSRRCEEDRGKRIKRDIKEEEIMDYMVKKAQKKALKVAKKLKANEVGYSNDSNPFGDSNLTEKFVRRKKIERDIMQGVPLDISVKVEKKSQREKLARFYIPSHHRRVIMQMMRAAWRRWRTEVKATSYDSNTPLEELVVRQPIPYGLTPQIWEVLCNYWKSTEKTSKVNRENANKKKGNHAQRHMSPHHQNQIITRELAMREACKYVEEKLSVKV